jgi:5-methylcytosine-specific restriction endonuclease McrA
MSFYKKKGKAYRRSDAGTLYLNLHPHCEACGFPSEQLHHILSRRSGGPDEEWNWMALCKCCHNNFHALGRASFAERYLATMDRIVLACERMGRKFNKGE